MKNENKTIVITSIISGVILVVALAFLLTFQPRSSINEDSITVQGISSVKALPDVISIHFSIETKGETSAEATQQNNEILENFTKAVIAEGFAKEDIKTENFNVYPNTYWENGRMKEDGYKAVHSLKIELSYEELNKVNELIDAGVKAKVGVSYINFELSQAAQNKYKAQALELAAQDAKIKAESIAKGFNKQVGKLISAQVNEFGYNPWNLYTSSAGGYAEDAVRAKEVVANIQPSEEEISASVSATYKMR